MHPLTKKTLDTWNDNSFNNYAPKEDDGAISLDEYVASNCPGFVIELVEKYGLSEPESFEQAVEALTIIINDYGEEAVKEIIAIHPDRQIILDAAGYKDPESKVELVMNKIYNNMPAIGKGIILGFSVYGLFQIINRLRDGG